MYVLMIESGMENIPIGVFADIDKMVEKAKALSLEEIEKLMDEFFHAANRERGMNDVIDLTCIRVACDDIGFPGLLNETHLVVREIMFADEAEVG